MYKYFINLPTHLQVLLVVYGIIALAVVYIIGYMLFMVIADEKKEIKKLEATLKANQLASDQIDEQIGGLKK